MKTSLGKLAYGALFCVALPALLGLWAWRLDAGGTLFWPQPFPAWLGVMALTAGALLMAVAMWALWSEGGGLPMNAYPPPRLVSGSVYAWLAHPIYVGFVLAVAGASVIAGSPAGLWLVTPAVALGAAVLVGGLEGPRLRERFGAPIGAPWFGLPLAGAARPGLARRASAALTALGPWVLLAALFAELPALPGVPELRLPGEAGLPHVAAAGWLSVTACALALLASFAAASGTQLRRFVRGAGLLTGLGFLLMLTLPGRVDGLAAELSPAGRSLAALQQTFGADWMAFPSFAAAWAVFGAALLACAWPRLRLAWWGWALAASVAGVFAGTQAVVGVLAGMALGLLGAWHEEVWRALVQIGERLGNSWSSVRIGPVRVISHALWSFVAAAAGTLLTLYLAGPALLRPCAWVLLAALLSAGTWGYLLEGGGRLSRPFGYYGFLIGGLLAIALTAWFDVPGWSTLAAAIAAAAPVTQAVGRVRCIVQGCCHGRPVGGAAGFRITHRMSRVTALASLKGVAIHPTPMYSIAGNVLLLLVLLRLWHTGAAWTLIGGLYLLLASMARFVEEQYRGEPQTVKWLTLPIYQWLAIGFALAGAAVTTVDGASVQSAQWLAPETVALALAIGAVTAFLMSIDFPDSARRFSRLTVRET